MGIACGTDLRTARPSLRGCVSKLSAMMVCVSGTDVKRNDNMLMLDSYRDGHIHEGE